MKVLVFAHTPPPFHGQSAMVQVLVDGLGGDARRRARPSTVTPAAPPTPAFGIECYHVNARVSTDLEDVGRMRWGKLFTLLGCCCQAVWLRCRHGVTTFYYVPAPPKRSALYRDWVVMALCRPFFRRLIFHWHGVGLGAWLEQQGRGWERRLAHWFLDGVEVAIVLSALNEADARRFAPRRCVVVANGLKDPCPEFASTLAPRRAARVQARRCLAAGQTPRPELTRQAGPEPGRVNVLFLAHCTREKGLFDAFEGVRLANARLEQQPSALRLVLTVVGAFPSPAERAEFERLLAGPGVGAWARYAGFVSAPAKLELLRETDVFCFPTYYAYEGQPMNLIEAMAFGVPLVTTRWRGIPELVPPDYPGLVEPRQPTQVAEALLAVVTAEGDPFRQRYLRAFTLDRHLACLTTALRGDAPSA